jgi:hypothetical protein
MRSRFSDPETWGDGFYELAIELGRRSDSRLDASLQSCWGYAGLDGCYARRDIDPSSQASVCPTLSELGRTGHLYGFAALPDVGQVPCGTTVVREEEALIDWLVFYIPLGALSRVDQRVGGYPFGPDSGVDSLIWRYPIDAWLAGLAQHIYNSVPFALALMGYEVSGDVSSTQLAEGIPPTRYYAIAHASGGQLAYFPATT